MKNYAQFVDLVNRYLERQERSAAWLSKQIGRHQATVSKWLSEHKRPGSPEIVVRMAAALELGVAECNELLKLAHYPHRVEDLRETVTDQDTQRAIAALDRRSSASSPVQATPSSAPLMPMQLHHPPPAPSSHAPPQFAEVLLEYVSKTFNEAYIDRREFGQLMRQLHEEISLIRKGLADAALSLSEPFHSSTVNVKFLRREPILVVAAPSHHLAQLDNVMLEDFQTETMLLTEAGCPYRRRFIRTLRSAAVSPANILEFHSLEAIKQCALTGMGVAVLPQVVVQPELNAGRLVNLQVDGLEFNMATQLLWHKDKWISPALQAFLEMTEEMLGQTAEDEFEEKIKERQIEEKKAQRVLMAA